MLKMLNLLWVLSPILFIMTLRILYLNKNKELLYFPINIIIFIIVFVFLTGIYNELRIKVISANFGYITGIIAVYFLGKYIY